MVYRGTVKHGVVEFEKAATLPDGTPVKIEPLVRHTSDPRPASLGWPPDYFEQTFGSITDETFARPPQGELPDAVELE